MLCININAKLPYENKIKEKTDTFPTVSAIRSMQGSGNGVPLSHRSSSFMGS